jgi:hypothetical protein
MGRLAGFFLSSSRIAMNDQRALSAKRAPAVSCETPYLLEMEASYFWLMGMTAFLPQCRPVRGWFARSGQGLFSWAGPMGASGSYPLSSGGSPDRASCGPGLRRLPLPPETHALRTLVTVLRT